jgi:ATP-binding cassette subfamily C protein PrsD
MKAFGRIGIGDGSQLVLDPRMTTPMGRREAVSAIMEARWPLVTVIVLSGLINLLMLTAPLFMLQVYDRVIPSRSVATLAGLACIAGILCRA